MSAFTRTPLSKPAIRKKRPRAGVTLITLGVLALVAELIRHYLGIEQGHAWPVGIGAFLIFLGEFARDPNRAIQGGTFVVNSTIGIASIVRGGRRATDPIVAVPVVTDEHATDAVDDEDGDGNAPRPPLRVERSEDR